ncbi:MAG TPA: DUF4129 domain-containing protein [Phototrophicaceae bacterium]|nr:DUF4129 domain-containing protein [Phototrophicaceae bacterium]
MSKSRRSALILLSGAALLILLLAMSLPRQVLFQGQPFSLDEAQPNTAAAAPALSNDDLFDTLFRGGMALVLVLVPVYIVYSLLTPNGRRRLIGNVILIIILLLIAQYIQDHPPPPNQQTTEAALGAQPPPESNGIPPSVFPTEPPPWLTVAVIAVFAAAVIAVILLIFWLRNRNQPKADLTMIALVEAAQSTIESIQAGGDLKYTVIRCYQEMMRVVREQRGIAREDTMTVREFEDELISRGLPSEAIRTLTRLFEQVRYGSLPTTDADEAVALGALTDIVNAIGGAKLA